MIYEVVYFDPINNPLKLEHKTLKEKLKKVIWCSDI